MKKDTGHVTAFYVETLVMIVVLMSILLILASVFGMSRNESVRAKRLTEAVTIAQNVAEAVSVSGDFEACCEELSLENSSLNTEGEKEEEFTGRYLWKEASGKQKASYYFVRVMRSWKDTDLAEHQIRVFDSEGKDLIYELNTSCYLPGEEGL